MLFTRLGGGAALDKPGAWDAKTDAAIGGADYGKAIDPSIYDSIKGDECSRRRTHCDWTVVGPVTARSSRWEAK